MLKKLKKAMIMNNIILLFKLMNNHNKLEFIIIAVIDIWIV